MQKITLIFVIHQYVKHYIAGYILQKCMNRHSLFSQGRLEIELH